MNLAGNIIINIYSVILLSVIYAYSLKLDGKSSFQHRLYIVMLNVAALLLIIDILGRFDGKPGTVYAQINYWGNLLIFSLSAILPSLWLMYVHYQIFQQATKTKRLILPLAAVNAANAFMVALSQPFGWFYYIDQNNIYHRGRYFILPVMLSILIIAASYALIIIDRKRINKKYYFPLAFFIVPPLVCIFLQVFIYGISLMLNGVVVSLCSLCF
ncbi:MAG TPA: hypothetical protein DCP97_05050 [Ruminococcaceae bacterium]|nr:hypothetical protein [Oscillospiraceae bacterium]